MRMPSTMVHTFSQVPKAEIPRSSFDRSHGLKTTLDAGFLVPIFVDEVLPGDTFNVQMTGFARLATPLHPYMDNARFNTFFFAVPLRLIWDNWERFNGAQTDPGDSTDYLVPQMPAPAGGWAVGSLGDYFGLPTGVAGINVAAFHFRAYNLIWNEWFRDQNLQDSLVVDRDDGPDDPASYVLRRRNKRHDYFTSSLPWPQKGESVSIPLGTTAPITTSATRLITGAQNAMTMATSAAGAIPGTVAGLGISNVGGTVGSVTGAATFGNGLYPTNLQADLSDATAATINQLRQAFQVQRLYERDARGGTRYTEIVRSHFGVVSPDARLQRPEYLGGGMSMVNIHQVPQTSTTENEPTPQGSLAAYGTSVMTGHGFNKSFTEHCVIIGLVCVTADLTYQQGLHRMWSRRARFDFYWPALSHIGEQAVLSKEIYCDGTAGDDSVWGYQERYAEYRYKPSQVTGLMRSQAAQSLDTWHLAQEFSTRPFLNSNFMQEDPPFDRVIAVANEPHFIGDFYFKFRAARPMPVYGVPGMMDHF